MFRRNQHLFTGEIEMKKTTYPIIVIVVALALAGFFAFRIVQGSGRANFISGANSASMGNLRRFEAQQAAQNAKAPGIGDLRRFDALRAPQNAAAPGIGDLRRFEQQQGALNSVPPINSLTKALGFGDLRRFEAEQTSQNAVSPVTALAKAPGFGDLHRFETLQASRSAAATIQQVCPNLSTSAGERDAGASAPAAVLQAIGC